MVKSALKNPYTVIVFALAILVIGLTAISRLPTDILPTFRTSAVQILTFYPGMPAEVMEKDITTQLERWTGQANGVARQQTKSMVGVSVVKDFFREDVDPNTAMSQITSLAMSDLYYLPPGMIPPMVMPFDPTASIPLALISVSSPTFDETKLYDGPTSIWGIVFNPFPASSRLLSMAGSSVAFWLTLTRKRRRRAGCLRWMSSTPSAITTC